MSAKVGLTGAWFDPIDPRTWSGMFAHVIEELTSMGVYAGFRDAGPAPSLSRVIHSWLAIAGRDRGTWTLQPEMLAAARLSAPIVRRRPPDTAAAWIVPAGTVGRPVAAPEVAWCELSPAQLLTMGTKNAAAFGLTGVTPRQLRATCRTHLQLHRRAKASCTVSASAAQSLVADNGLAAVRVHVVGCGRNIEPTDTVSHDWSKPRFLFVGNDWNRKNGDAVIRAFRRLRTTMPVAQLDVAGGHPLLHEDGVNTHGPLRLDQAEDRARLAALFAGSTCFVMPSYAEPFGIVYVEAASFGIASIAGNIGGTTTSVGNAGVLVDPSDDTAILEAMQRLADPRCAAEMGARAAGRADQFTWRKVAERLLRATGLPAFDGRELAGFIEADPAGGELGENEP
jgi:hypothetical protein